MLNPFGWLNSKQSEIYEWWQRKKPSEKWDFIIKIGRVTSNAIGVHVLDDMRVNWFSATGGILLFLFFALNFYTMQYYWFRGAFVRGLECTYLVGFVIGVRISFHEVILFLMLNACVSLAESLHVLGICWAASFQIQCRHSFLWRLFLQIKLEVDAIQTLTSQTHCRAVENHHFHFADAVSWI